MIFTKAAAPVLGFIVASGLLGVGDLVVPSSQPITVHSLDYEAGVIHQSRTVLAKNDTFFAQWSASIVHADTGVEVAGCAGRGSWPYPSGSKIFDIPLTTWVGSDTCTPEYLASLGGTFKPIASWHWGDDSTTHEGKEFTP